MTSNISFIRTPSEEIFEKHRGLVKKTTMKRLRGWLILYAVLTVVALGMYRTGFFDLDRFISGFKQLGYMFKFMMPPAVNSSFFEFLGGIFETLAMAFLGTLLASIGALVIGFSAAKNIVSNRILHFTVRRGMDWVRGIDSLIWALVFIHVVGLGPFAGIMAIAVSDTATLSKMFSEAIENADPKPTEGILSAGGNKLQVVRFAILPQVLPVLLSHVLYQFESNTRTSTILGVVGAGGIGLQLSDRIKINNWDEVSTIIIMILVTVSLIDIASRNIRKRFIEADSDNAEVLKGEKR